MYGYIPIESESLYFLIEEHMDSHVNRTMYQSLEEAQKDMKHHVDYYTDNPDKIRSGIVLSLRKLDVNQMLCGNNKVWPQELIATHYFPRKFK